MIEVGFWRRYEDINVDSRDLRPWPSKAKELPKEIKEAVVEYLSLGYIESYEFGYATCRICGDYCDEMGCCSLSDGTYVWPEGLKHYVIEHFIELPSEFVNHALQNLSTLRQQHKDRKITPEELCLLEWREEEKIRIRSNNVASFSFLLSWCKDKCCFCY